MINSQLAKQLPSRVALRSRCWVPETKQAPIFDSSEIKPVIHFLYPDFLFACRVSALLQPYQRKRPRSLGFLELGAPCEVCATFYQRNRISSILRPLSRALQLVVPSPNCQPSLGFRLRWLLWLEGCMLLDVHSSAQRSSAEFGEERALRSSHRLNLGPARPPFAESPNLAKAAAPLPCASNSQSVTLQRDMEWYRDKFYTLACERHCPTSLPAIRRKPWPSP